MKKGFTLIEMIAVIGIIALMTIMVMPAVVNQIANKKEDISETTNKLIFNAAELYLNDNIVNYPKTIGSKYCIKLETLITEDYLKSPLKDAVSGKNIDTSRRIKLDVNGYGEYDNYELLEKGKETEVCN